MAVLADERANAEKVKAGEELTALQNVAVLLEAQQKGSVAELEGDLTFVGKQITAIKQIKEINDPEQAEELVNLMLEDGFELTDGERFKADITAESDEAKEDFSAMISDIKAVLVEEGAQELERLLEAHVQANQSADESEANELRANKSGNDDTVSSAADDDGGCQSACQTCTGCNVFAGFEAESEAK